MSEKHFVTTVESVAEGTGCAFEVNDRIIALFRVDGQFYAIEDACPHMGASLSTGELDGCIVSCPLHAWRFDIRDGAWADNPRIRTDSYPVTVEDGKIFVAMDD